MSENEIEKSVAPDSGTDEALLNTGLPPAQKDKPPAWMWVGLGVLFVVALMVVFVLPAVVSEYELPLERRVETTPTAPARSQPTTPEISPFEEAQRAIQRKEAQDVLAVLLERQAELTELEVSAWAEQAYESALAEASAGDEFYRTQNFERATASYETARDQLIALLESVPQVAERVLVEGAEALAAGDSTVAQERYSLAMLLAPESEAAQIGLQRARSLDEVLGLLGEAEMQIAEGDLEDARAVLQQSIALDSYNATAQQRLEEVEQAIAEAEFSRVMSEGYALLEQGRPQEAIAAFGRAATLGVNAEQAEAAIVQTETEVANAEIAEIRQQITTAEANEQWQDAVAGYDEVLSIDPNLTFASTGRDYASKRAQLDQLLEYAIATPERFADEAVFQETVDIYYTGRDIQDPGPRLVGQLDELQGLLENSQVPREVTLVSDNLTEVSILRVSELGLFDQTTVSLKPGNYVALGRRAGYREVRQEFTVGFGQTPERVIVQCEERVVAASR